MNEQRGKELKEGFLLQWTRSSILIQETKRNEDASGGRDAVNPCIVLRSTELQC